LQEFKNIIKIDMENKLIIKIKNILLLKIIKNMGWEYKNPIDTIYGVWYN